MSAGSQTRWSYFRKTDWDVKQLIPINGVPLLTKIQNQFPGSIVVISKNEYKDKLLKHSNSAVILEKTGSLVESLSMTNKLWTDCNVILLGDVLYSSHTIDQVKKCQANLMFFGNSEEIYALVFKDKEEIYRLSRECLEQGGKKLWDLYRVSQGIDLKEHRIKDNFTRTKDTRDFDCVLQYIKFLECQKKKK